MRWRDLAGSNTQFRRSKRSKEMHFRTKAELAPQENKARNKAQISRVVEYVSAPARYSYRHPNT
jgi:hypothetical protein